MCRHCNYEDLLSAAGLEPTQKRLQVLEVVGANRFPLPAADIHTTLNRHQPINRVTVYRILDLLVEKDVVERISTGGRAAYYGLAPNAHHRPHPHFYCKTCGRMDCLAQETLDVDYQQFSRTFPGRIDKLEIRLDGICRHCLNLATGPITKEKEKG